MNVYLEKIAAQEDRRKEKSHFGKKLAAGVGASILPSVVLSPPSIGLAQSAMSDMAKDGVSESTLAGFKNHLGMNHITHNRHDLPGVGPAYHPQINQVFSKSNMAAMHEYGHAHNFNSLSRDRQRLKQIGYMAGKTGMGALAGTVVALSGEPSDTKTAVGTGIAAASYVPMLQEEASASLKPLKYMADNGLHAERRISQKALLKAFGTYGLTAAAGIATPYLASALYKKLHPNKTVRKDSTA